MRFIITLLEQDAVIRINNIVIMYAKKVSIVFIINYPFFYIVIQAFENAQFPSHPR
jgi:hypothetical protein